MTRILFLVENASADAFEAILVSRIDTKNKHGFIVNAGAAAESKYNIKSLISIKASFEARKRISLRASLSLEILLPSSNLSSRLMFAQSSDKSLYVELAAGAFIT